MLDNFIEQPLAVVKGDTIRYNFLVDNIGEDEEFDEIAFTIKANAEDETPVVSSTMTNGKIKRVGYDAEKHRATYYVEGASSETENLTPNTFAYYDIRGIFDDAVVTMLRGRVKVLLDITEFGGNEE